MEKTRAEQLMELETRVRYGAVPHSLTGPELYETNWQLDGDEFLLRGEGDHYFHYQRGQGITIERGGTADVSEESLWLNGSVYAAVASINGLLPVHASAVAVDNRVFAFTGTAGAGKSTLVAALGGHGLPMFCDDTLVLDLSDPEQIICLPGHKRLKLTAEALCLSGAEGEEKVSSTVDKFYARPPCGTVRKSLPLAELIFLEEGNTVGLSPIRGVDRCIRLQDDHYTSELFARAQRFDRVLYFEHLAKLARRIQMRRLTRPLDKSRFQEATALVRGHIVNGGHSST